MGWGGRREEGKGGEAEKGKRASVPAPCIEGGDDGLHDEEKERGAKGDAWNGGRGMRDVDERAAGQSVEVADLGGGRERAKTIIFPLAAC